MIARRAVLLAPLALAACAGDDPPTQTSFPELHYDYLTPLRLNVGAVDVADGPPPGPLDVQNPVPPGTALRRMAQDRIGAGGSTGRAVFTIDTATITQGGPGLSGIMAVHLDILGPEGGRVAFAEARVFRGTALPRRGDLRGTLYNLTRAMMDDMNVELEFQVRRNLRDWLQEATTAPGPAPVERQDLSAPGRAGPPPES